MVFVRNSLLGAAILSVGVGLAGCHAATGLSPLTPVAEASSAASAPIKVTTLKDSGAGSLRAAIAAANERASASSPTAIRFTVHGTIRLASSLPAIETKVTIDGTTAPTYSGNGPVVEIDARHFGGLVLASGSDGSKILALAIDNAKGNGVTLNAGTITLNLDYIGLTISGAALGNSGDGVYVSAQSANDSIGLNAKHVSGAVANVISGNRGNGVSFNGSSGSTVAANRIGTDPTGKSAIGNGENGILIAAASDGNEIGGTEFVDSATGKVNNPTGSKGTVPAVFVVPPLGNLISGNAANGILIDGASENNTLNGNFIGTTANGDGALGNAGDGVRIDAANNNSLIGCKFKNNPFVYYNVLSGNGAHGLHVTNTDGTIVQGNFFGIGADNTNVLANGGDGILIDGSSAGTTVGGVIPLGNVSAGNELNGIEVAGTASGFLTFNTFGGLLAFKHAAPNGNDGLLITSTGGSQTVRTNVFSGNKNNGIEIGGNATGVTVDPDIVGLDTNGMAAMPNGGDGLRIDGTAHGNVIGGYTQSVIPQDTFSGNLGYGIDILGSTTDNQVFNSYVGSDVVGLTALGNGKGGIFIGGSSNHETIGGTPTSTSEPTKNLISGNDGIGVTLAAGTSYIGVIGNWIGIDRNGKHALPNKGKPIVVRPGSTNNTISGNVTKPQ